jgi:hypothetical protein
MPEDVAYSPETTGYDPVPPDNDFAWIGLEVIK